MLSNLQEDNHENGIISFPAERIIAEGPWTPTQQRLIEVLQRKEYQFASIAQICQAAGYSGNMAWYQAMKDPRFAAVVQALGALQGAAQSVGSLKCSNIQRTEASRACRFVD